MKLKAIETIWASGRSYTKVGLDGCVDIDWDLNKNIVYLYLTSGLQFINLNNTISFHVVPVNPEDMVPPAPPEA